MNESRGRTIHHTQLHDLPPEDALQREWNTYRRELPRLLAEGHEGKVALIKGEEVVSLWPTWNEALAEGGRLYLLEPFLIKPIHEYEPLLRVPHNY